MLPINVLGNWCSVDRPRGHVREALYNVSDDVSFGEYESGGASISWTERSNLSFGGTEWYTVAGSLLLEARRAVFYRERPEGTYLFLIALLPTSRIHLKNRISSLLKQHLKAELNPVNIRLDKIAGELLPKDVIRGYSILTSLGGRHLILDPGSDWLQNVLSHFLEHSTHSYSLSELYLEIGEQKTELILSREGTLTFTDPEVSFTCIDSAFDFLTRIYSEESQSQAHKEYSHSEE